MLYLIDNFIIYGIFAHMQVGHAIGIDAASYHHRYQPLHCSLITVWMVILGYGTENLFWFFDNNFN